MNNELLSRIKAFTENYPADPAVQDRIVRPAVSFIGEETIHADRLLFYARERKVLSKVQNVIGAWL